MMGSFLLLADLRKVIQVFISSRLNYFDVLFWGFYRKNIKKLQLVKSPAGGDNLSH